MMLKIGSHVSMSGKKMLLAASEEAFHMVPILL